MSRKKQHLYLARWPDGSATLVAATSPEHVADLLDEIDDPGACEVVPYDGSLVIDIEPTANIEAGLLQIQLQSNLDESPELALLEAAFPHLHSVVNTAMEERDERPTAKEWAQAVERERSRPLRPSAEWAGTVSAWWEDVSGGRPDQTAALREMMNVSIPGEPKPETPEQQAMFEAAQRRMLEHVATTLTPRTDSKPTSRTKRPTRSRPKKK